MSDPILFIPGAVRRFEAKLSEGPGGCWLWLASKDRDGYGKFYPKGSIVWMAHRWSYEYHVVEIPDGLQLDHLCRVKACCNPAHLDPVTASVNCQRAVQNPCTHGKRYTYQCGQCLRNRQAKRSLRLLQGH
jgi:hypothetical protein